MNIYKLEFSDGSTYVGSTINRLQTRYSQHKTLLLKGSHHSHKVQSKYNNLGLPKIELLDTVPNSIGHECEKIWISILDTYTNGLNCSKGGEGECGENHPQAQHYLEDYAAVVNLLANTDWTLKEVSDELEISYNIVCSISSGNSHIYLAEKLPDIYKKMRSKAGTRAVTSQRRTPYPSIVSPQGIIYSVGNILQFSKSNNLLDSEVSRVLNGLAVHHRGWHLESTKLHALKSPEGIIYTIGVGGVTRFAKQYALDPSNLNKVLKGQAKSCKGWTLA